MQSKPRTALILAGGPATLNEIQFTTYPKLCLPIANRPLLDYLAIALKAGGVERMIIVSDIVAGQDHGRWLDRIRAFGLNGEWMVQETPRGTAGTLKEYEDRIGEDCFWVVNGELFLGLPLAGMLASHREHGTIATVGAVRMDEPAWQMERVQTEAAGKIKAIHRIHPAANKRSTLRPAGVYLFERAVLDFIPQEGYFDLKEQVFSQLYDHNTPAQVWEIEGYCRTITSLEEYLAANRDVLLRHVQFDFSDFAGALAGSCLPDSQRTASRITLLDPVAIGAGTTVGAGTIVVGPTSIGDHCTIGDGVVLDNCLVFPGAQIGEQAHLSRCVVGPGSIVDTGTTLRGMVIVKDIDDLKTPPAALHSENWPLGVWCSTSPNKTKSIGKYYFHKRTFDMLFSAVCLIAAAPLMLVIAIAIKLDSPGRIVFGQRRSTSAGRQFVMYKFRSMVENAEEVKRRIQHMNEVDGPMFKITDDPRITRLGRFLRKTNLDELPQFWNVLKGDMSLVGPRPLSMDEMSFNPRWRDVRLSVRPGLTGLWQVQSHDKTAFADWIRYDTEYVQQCSPRLDGQILFRTIGKTVQGFVRTSGSDISSK